MDTNYIFLWILTLMLKYYPFKNEFTLYPPSFAANQIVTYNFTDQSHCFI